MSRRGSISLWRRLRRGCVVAGGSLAMTLLVFLVLPLTQVIGKPPEGDTLVREVGTANLPPPPPPPEEEPVKKEETEPKAPELEEAAPPLDLAQLEVALNPGAGGSGAWTTPDLGMKLVTMAASGGDVDALFSLSDLDQKPRVLYQPSPNVDPGLRKKTPASVVVMFVVDPSGRVERPIVQSATDPAFEGPALAAVRQWRFEPGRRNGQPVRFRMRVPISFPQG